MPDIKQIFTFLEPDQGMLDGKSCNPWADASFNYCTLEPGADDFEEKAGIESTTIEKITTIIDKGSCYWKKIGADIYYDMGDVLMGVSTSPGEGRVTIQKPGTLGLNLDLLELVNSATGTNIIGTASSIVWYLNHEDTTEKSSRTMARITAGVESNWASNAWVLFQEVDRFGVYKSSDPGDNNFLYPRGICTDGTYMYICDSNNDRIVKRSLWDYSVINIVGGTGAGNGNFDTPSGICTDGIYLYIADEINNRIKVHLCSDLSYVRQFGTTGTGNNNFIHPYGICLIGSTLYIVDQANCRVKKHLVDGIYVSEYGSFGTGDNYLDAPSMIFTDGIYIYIADDGNNRLVKRLASDLTYVTKKTSFQVGGGCYEDGYLYVYSGGFFYKLETNLATVDSSAVGATVNGIMVYGRYFYATDYFDENGLSNSGIGVLIAPKGIVAANVFNSYLGFSTAYQGITQEWVRITSQGYMGINTLNPDERLDVHGNVKVDGNTYISTKSFIGNETLNVDMEHGLTINVELHEDQALAFKATGNVAHGMTTLVETDTFADMRVNTANGGIEINGYTAGTIGIGLYSFYTTGNTDLDSSGFATHTLYPAKKSGTTYGNCGATDNIFCLRPRMAAAWTSVMLVNAGGNAWFSGKVEANQLDSNVAIGTAPIIVTSTTLCTNLNADYLDGQHGAYYSPTAHDHDSAYISIIAAPAANHFPYQTVGGELIDSGYDAADFEPDIAAGTSAQYWRGDKAWATLNQATVAGLTIADGPTFAHLHLSDLASIYTPAESWIGPSSTTGIYFKGNNVGIGTMNPGARLEVAGGTVFINHKPAPGFYAQAEGVNKAYLGYDGAGTGVQVYNFTSTYSLMVLNTGALTYPGNVGIGTPSPTSPLQVVGLPAYANNAAAVAGGLTAGAFYRTGADPDPVCVVH